MERRAGEAQAYFRNALKLQIPPARRIFQSARRPDIREDFRRAQSFSLRIEKPQGFSML